MPSEEELLLLFKESGVEFVETAAKAVGELGDKMESVNQAQQAAVEVLKEEGTVVEDLEAKIRKLKAELEALADAHKAGLITQSAYKEQTDALVKVISENETVLKRLTASQREAEAAEKAAEKAAEEEAAALAKITAALNQLELEEERELIEAEKLAEKHYQMMEAAEAAAGTGSGEGGKGGFAGLAANVMKAEKVMAGLASGSGFGRMGGMLESITGALGLAGGTGMAAGGLIFAFEALIPKIEKFMEKMDGAAEATKRAAEALKIYHAEVKKEEDAQTPDEEKAAAVVKDIIKGKGAQELRQGIEQSLVQQGIGLTAEQRAGQYLNPETLQMTKFSPEEMEEFGQRSREAAQARAGQLMLELRRGAPGAITAIRGMSHVPESFRTRLGQTTPEAIEAAKQQAQKAEADSEWADTTYAKREAARKESSEIDIELDKARKDKHKKEDAWDKFDRHLVNSEEDRVARENKAAKTKAEHDARAAKTKAKHDARAAKTKAEHDAKQNTPEVREHQALTAQRNEEMGMAQQVQAARAGAGDTMASQMGPAELQQVVAAVGRNRMMNSSLGFTLAQQVDYYMSQLEAKMVADFTRGMGQQNRSAQLITPRGGF
jgi:hypothetical protein